MTPTFRLSALGLLLASTWPALAQIPPDAGQTLQQQMRPPPELPKESHPIEIQAPATLETLPGGLAVAVKSLRFAGHSRFDDAQLQAVLGEVRGKSYDLAGLRGLANQISDHYRAMGYPFARAYLPAQAMTEGELLIEVVEGKYGQVTATGDSDLIAAAQGFLSALKPGLVIESAPLERAGLIADDQPGIKTSLIIRPGQEIGTGDLDMQVRRTQRFAGDVGLDNQGNRYTGEYRARLNLQADSPFLFGDQLSLRSLLSDEGQWLGSLTYSLPLGGDGLRANVGYAHTYYELTKQFASLQSYGTADVSSLGLTYPLLRSQQSNLTLATTLQHKELKDVQGLANTQSDKQSETLPITLQFDRRDGFVGGGVTYGSVTWTPGDLKLGSNLLVADKQTAKTNGNFNKWNIDIARLHALPAGLTLYGRASGQWTNKNLDSSEGFGLGGANGVRAYPSGEGYGSLGWLTQLELRYPIGTFAPFAFYDAGKVTINAEPWAAGNNKRKLAGAGLGLRFNNGPWSVEGLLAWRTEGDKPTSDTEDRNPRVWVTAGYRF